MHRRRSKILVEAVLETARALRATGAVSQAQMRHFERLCKGGSA